MGDCPPFSLTSAPKVETMAKRSIVGELINFRGLVYGPVNEMGVVALFTKVGEELGCS